MAHEIDITTGAAAVFVTGEPAWHRLGKVIESATTSSEAIQLAGLDWRVEQFLVRALTRTRTSSLAARTRWPMSGPTPIPCWALFLTATMSSRIPMHSTSWTASWATSWPCTKPQAA